ncbi:MAG TPA: DUF2314 domain-containing protein [Gemmatimonadaceae bacterium]|nr:DUF2314 domain-containing protein [Gemmatimonadaceae bacterium]
MTALIVMLLQFLIMVGATAQAPIREYAVGSEEEIFDVVEGVWGWPNAESGCAKNPHTIRFSADRRQMLIGNALPDSAGRYRIAYYDIQWVSPSRIRGRIVDETRKTVQGVPVVWELVLESRDRYRWHRTDWQRTGFTQAITRCAPRMANAKVSGAVVNAAGGSARIMRAFAAGDSARAAAVERARARVDELVEAIDDSADGRQISVLAPIADGERIEFEWISKVSYDGWRLHGTLAAEPAKVKVFHRGDEVVVPLFDVADWVVAGSGRSCGGFTQRPATADTTLCATLR